MERQWWWAELAETSSFIAHRRQVLRCAPEQLRHASFEERTVVEFPDNELLGIKNLLEKGQFPKSQFTDLIPEGNPPDPDVVSEAVHNQSLSGAVTAAENLQQQQAEESVMPDPPVPRSAVPTERNASSDKFQDGRYGPMRVRHTLGSRTFSAPSYS